MKASSQDKALIITFSSACVLVLFFFFTTLTPFQDEIEEEYLEIPIVQEPALDEKQLEEMEQAELEKMTHQAYNRDRALAEAQRLLDDPDEIREALENKELSDISELMEESKNDFSDNREGRDLAFAIAKKSPPHSTGDNLKKETAQTKTNVRRTTISYHLKDREAIQIPNPVYTCDALGKVVINITVGGNGRVQKTSFNQSASTTTNGCLIDQATQYAMKAYFDGASRNSQIGTITFLFQG